MQQRIMLHPPVVIVKSEPPYYQNLKIEYDSIFTSFKKAKSNGEKLGGVLFFNLNQVVLSLPRYHLSLLLYTYSPYSVRILNMSTDGTNGNCT